MTVSHGVHLVGALGALTYLTVRQARRELTPRRQSALKATALFWHFMAALWLCILVLLTRL
jgi:heme/copper-type cytochrome/quinol oxidase subunit 3